jgi:hypothetical protein
VEINEPWKDLDLSKKTALCMQLFGYPGWKGALEMMDEYVTMRSMWGIEDKKIMFSNPALGVSHPLDQTLVRPVQSGMERVLECPDCPPDTVLMGSVKRDPLTQEIHVTSAVSIKNIGQSQEDSVIEEIAPECMASGHLVLDNQEQCVRCGAKENKQ